MSADVHEIDCLVIGAGVVGLACAAALARAGREVLVAERADAIGTGISARNSEVIHAGIYYPNGSRKHLYCVEGRRRLYAYAAERGVTHKKCGKLIVAARDAEIAQIETLARRAGENGVENCALLSAAEARALEPNLACVAALHSPETGIVDAHGLMLALRGELEDHGGAIAFNSAIVRGALDAGDAMLTLNDGAQLRCRIVINAAGLDAHAIAAAIEGAQAPAPLTLAKGSYFGCARKPAFSRLIYPAPVDGGLGVHLTLDLGGRMRFGPDVEWLDHGDPARVDYSVDPARADAFYAAIRTYWPALPDGALTPDYSGCRPKLSARGAPAADFEIARHGALINLFGIESPGLTSSLAIGAHVAALARD